MALVVVIGCNCMWLQSVALQVATRGNAGFCGCRMQKSDKG